MKEITNIFEIKPGNIYVIHNKKEMEINPHSIEYKVVSVCRFVSDGKQFNSYPTATFDDIKVFIGGNQENLKDWRLDSEDLETRCNVYEITPEEYPEYYI